MKIGFAGTHSTGKTSLLNAMMQDRDIVKAGYSAVPSTAREAIKHGHKVNREASQLDQLIVMASRITQEDVLTAEDKSTISDRTPLDSLAYTDFQYQNVWEDTSQFYMNVSRDLAKKAMRSYGLVFYFPIYWPLVEDGTRDNSYDYQKTIDQYIQYYLKEFKVWPITVPDMPVRERLWWMKYKLREESFL